MLIRKMCGRGRKTYSSCLIAVSILIITYVIYNKTSETLSRTNGADNYESIQSKRLKKNIFFLKTHKTASTTVNMMLVRFGVKHSLDMAYHKGKSETFNETYTGPLKKEYFENEPLPPHTKFNMLAEHSRYRHDTHKFLYPDVVRVTILRDPPEQFESSFHFFEYSKKIRTSWRQFLDILPINNTAKYLSRITSRIQPVHFMSYDLGLDCSNFHNHEEISKFIRRIDDEFHLVMIKEHLEASLVLLANLMGWPLHYVSFISQYVRTERNNLSKIDRLKLTQLNLADHLLYQHFLRKFQKLIVEYGFEKMAADIQKLQAINSEFQRRCFINAEDNMIVSNSLKLRENANFECILSSLSDLRYQYISKWKDLRVKSIKKLQDFMKVKYEKVEI